MSHESPDTKTRTGIDPHLAVDLTDFQPSVSGVTFTANKLVEGNIFPVSEHVILGHELGYAVVDIEPQVESVLESLNPEMAAYWAEAAEEHEEWGRSIRPELFGKLFDLNSAIWSKGYSANPNRSRVRHQYYELRHAKGMSAMLEASSAKCVEVATLAQMCLQKMGIKSRYVSGGHLSERQAQSESDRYPDAHAYLLVEDGERKYVYDPYHTIRMNLPGGAEGFIPMILAVRGDFLAILKGRGEAAVIEGRPLNSVQKKYYGLAHGIHITDDNML